MMLEYPGGYLSSTGRFGAFSKFPHSAMKSTVGVKSISAIAHKVHGGFPHERRKLSSSLLSGKTAPFFMDLFAGCGGLSLGLLQSGWKGLFAIEKSPDAFKTFCHNLVDSDARDRRAAQFKWPVWLPKGPHEISSFVRKYRGNIKGLRGKVHLVAGGPPCQGFSFAGKRNGRDPRNTLFKHHLEIVDLIRPEFVLLENVRGISVAFKDTKKERTRRSLLSQSHASMISKSLSRHYHVQYSLVQACHFGVPQMRSRYFIIGIRKDIFAKKDLPDFFSLLQDKKKGFLKKRGLPQRPITVAEAISDLRTAGKRLVECSDAESPMGFKEIVCKKPSTPYQMLMSKGLGAAKINSLRLANHKAKTIRKFERILKVCRKGVSLSNKDRARLRIKKHSLTPLAPKLPSKTVTTLPEDLLHYAEPRIHTVRETARIQSFPDWFEFKGKYTTGGNKRQSECPRYTQVGNAIPPLLAEAVGEVFIELLRLKGINEASLCHQGKCV